MSKTEKELTELKKNLKGVCRDKKTLENFEKSAKEFQSLIDNGLTKSRGYNLETIEDSRCNAFTFNMVK